MLFYVGLKLDWTLPCTCLLSSLTSLVQAAPFPLIQVISLFHLPISILYLLIFSLLPFIFLELNFPSFVPLLHFFAIFIFVLCLLHCGPGSSVGIATDCRLDDPWSNPCWDEIFCPSRPALGPTHPPVKWVPVLSLGLSAARVCCWPVTPLLCRGHGRVELYLTHPLSHAEPVIGSHTSTLLFSTSSATTVQYIDPQSPNMNLW